MDEQTCYNCEALQNQLDAATTALASANEKLDEGRQCIEAIELDVNWYRDHTPEFDSADRKWRDLEKAVEKAAGLDLSEVTG